MTDQSSVTKKEVVLKGIAAAPGIAIGQAYLFKKETPVVEAWTLPAEGLAFRDAVSQFERQLIDFGTIIFKFWLHISHEEQLKRFKQREHDTFKAYKLTEEDWRNRDRWDLYEVAINQAIARTSTPAAPWTIVPANDKYYARVDAIETVINAIKAELKRR